MFVFVVIVLAVLGSAVAFVVESWILLGELPPSLWRGVFYGVGLGFVPATILATRRQHRILRSYLRLSSLFLGFLNYAFFATVLVWAIALTAGILGNPVNGRDLVFAAALAAALVTIAGVLNAAKMRVRRVSVVLPELPASWRGRSIVFLSDIHLGNVRGRRFLKRVLARIDQQKPAAIWIGGDLFDGAKVDFEACARDLGALKTSLGTYYVTGNHDEFRDRRRILEALEQNGVRCLCNALIDLDGLQLMGVLDEDSGDPGRLRQILQSLPLDSKRPAVLLCHQPRSLAVVEAAGIDLQLSGHTHGGQFWPWTHVARRVHGPFNYGLHRFGKTLQVLTSSGIGSWGPPMRVGTTPEIVVVDFSVSGG